MREDILKRAIEGVEDDLDELGEQLYVGLERYDAEIALVAHELPTWLGVSAQDLRGPLRFKSDDLGVTMLGPHAVGQAAAKIDAFVRTWLGEGDEIARPDLMTTPGIKDDYEAALEALRAQLGRVDAELVERARDARHLLEGWGDEILGELELKRKRDAEAIEALVAEGTIEPGRDTRTELAELWEEQRRKAAHIERRWVRVEALAERGEVLARSGLRDLVDLVDHVASMMLDGFPGLDGRVVELAPDTLAPDTASPDTLIPGDFEVLEEAPIMVDMGGDAFSFDTDLDEPAPSLLFDDIDDIDDAGPTSPPGDEFDPYALLEQSAATEDTGPSATFAPATRATSEALAEPNLATSGPMIDFFDDDDGADTSAFYISHASSEEPIATNVPPDTTLDYDVFQSVEAPSTLSMQLGDDDELTFDDAPVDETDEPIAFDVFGQDDEEPRGGDAPRTDTRDDLASMYADAPTHDTLILDDTEDAPLEQDERATIDTVSHDTLILDDARDEDLGQDEDPGEAADEPDTEEPGNEELEAEEISAEEPEAEDAAADASPAPTPRPAARPAARPADEPAAEEQDALARPRPTPTTLRARRRRPGIVKVSSAEIALALGLPLALAFGLIAAAFVTDLPGWTRWFGVALLTWFVVGPLVMGWRARWKGWMPFPTRRATLIDEAAVEVTEESVKLGPWAIRWDHELEISRERWAEPDHGSLGWALHVAEEGGDRLTFSVSLSDEDAWGATGWPLAGAPRTPWELDASDFAELSESVERISASLASRGEAA